MVEAFKLYLNTRRNSSFHGHLASLSSQCPFFPVVCASAAETSGVGEGHLNEADRPCNRSLTKIDKKDFLPNTLHKYFFLNTMLIFSIKSLASEFSQGLNDYTEGRGRQGLSNSQVHYAAQIFCVLLQKCIILSGDHQAAKEMNTGVSS